MTLTYYREPSGRYLALEPGGPTPDVFGLHHTAWVFALTLFRFTCLTPEALARCDRVELSDIPEPWRSSLAAIQLED